MKFCACCFDKNMKTMLNTFLLLIAGLLKESKRNTLLGCAHSDEFGTFNYVLHSTIEKENTGKGIELNSLNSHKE